jgi:hypothetical protein
MSPGVPAIYERLGDDIRSEKQLFLVHFLKAKKDRLSKLSQMDGAASDMVDRQAITPPFQAGSH